MRIENLMLARKNFSDFALLGIGVATMCFACTGYEQFMDRELLNKCEESETVQPKSFKGSNFRGFRGGLANQEN